VNALSLKGFLAIAAVAAVVCAAAAGVACALADRLDVEAGAAILAGGVALGLMTAGVVYLVQLTAEVRRLDLDPDELLPGESLLMQTAGPMVHYRTGRPRRPLDGVGGKLFLTTHRVIFLAHRGQPWHYRLDIPLEEIEEAAPCKVWPGVRGGLQVSVAGGRREVFTFGAVRAAEADEWGEAIRLAVDGAASEPGSG
jgi:hypothetical protein